MFEAEFWVAVAFVVFLGVLGYVGAHTRLLKGIDDRRERIKSELDEARRLKAEAEALLATYRRRQQEAEREAETIVASAKVEAERLAAEAEAKIEEFIARHTKMGKTRSPRPKLRRWLTCARPQPTSRSPQRKRFSAAASRTSSRTNFCAKASPISRTS